MALILHLFYRLHFLLRATFSSFRLHLRFEAIYPSAFLPTHVRLFHAFFSQLPSTEGLVLAWLTLHEEPLLFRAFQGLVVHRPNGYQQV